MRELASQKRNKNQRYFLKVIWGSVKVSSNKGSLYSLYVCYKGPMYVVKSFSILYASSLICKKLRSLLSGINFKLGNYWQGELGKWYTPLFSIVWLFEGRTYVSTFSYEIWADTHKQKSFNWLNVSVFHGFYTYVATFFTEIICSLLYNVPHDFISVFL